MKYTKMHGIGNNYIYVNCFEEKIEPEQMGIIAERVADKNFGIGADGAIFICPSDEEGVDGEMRMYNADGSYGKMCGNGIRCVAKYMYDQGIVDKTELTIVSGGQKKYLTLYVKKEVPGEDAKAACGIDTGKRYSKRPDGMVVDQVKVDMGEPIFAPEEIPMKVSKSDKDSADDTVFVKQEELTEVVTPAGKKEKVVLMYPYEVDGITYKGTCVSVGNPHCIIYMDEVKSLDLDKIGPSFENHELFPERVNTEFVRVIDRQNVEMRVYERGSGETLACGTGGTAVAVASILNGYTDTEVTVHLLGGNLKYEWDKDTNHMIMTGPAQYICEGEL